MLEYIKANRLVYFLAACFVSSVVVPLSFNQLPYILGLGLMSLHQFLRMSEGRERTNLFVAFLIILAVGSVLNSCLSARLVVFVFVVIITCGLLKGEENQEMRADVFTAILDLIFVVNIFNIYAYFAGVNYYDGKYIGFKDYFSGYTPHPMWLAVVAGVANIVNVKRFVEAEEKWVKAVMVGVILLTIFLQITAGSRAGLLATVAGLLVYLKTYIQNMPKVIGYVVVAAVVVYLFLPLLMSDAGLLQEKVDTQDLDDNSRTGLWGARIDEFLSSPLFGIGFARGYVNGALVEGRLETGSGWLAVLSQTGIFAFICIVGVVFSIFRSIGDKYLENKELFLGVFVFLCVHSMFEGYLYTSFYMPCLLFWLLAGILMQAPYAADVIDDDDALADDAAMDENS
ncbi:MAG: O-antigen ligase family protein [Bacteroidales bacterium]|nr:O-antigen ligase family protein [Bacteroidales bacterium]